MTEETKKQEEMAEAEKDRLRDILKGLGLGTGYVQIHDAVAHVYPHIACTPSGEPILYLKNRPSTEKHLEAYVISGEKAGQAVRATILVSGSNLIISEIADSEEQGEQAIGAYLMQIDQSREQAQATQAEIDQLRTETRDLISKLLAA
jgi:hypothetical protein